MFTGLISDVGTVTMVTDRDAMRQLQIRSAYSAESIAIGASIACQGPCLTVTSVEEAVGGSLFAVDVGAETLQRTTAGQWTVGQRLNLERSLKAGDELGGHLVTGHVDSTGDIIAIDALDAMRKFVIRVPREYTPLVAEKGSICLDGTSLTVNSLSADTISVLLIPHSLEATTWIDRVVGDCINIEVDLMARYAARLLETRYTT